MPMEGIIAHNVEYLFMKLGSTRVWADNESTVDRIGTIWRVDARGRSVPSVVAGDEETFRFMYHLIRSNPSKYKWMRIYVDAWHLLLRMGKALIRRYWGIGIGVITKSLGTDGKKAAKGGNTA